MAAAVRQRGACRSPARPVPRQSWYRRRENEQGKRSGNGELNRRIPTPRPRVSQQAQAIWATRTQHATIVTRAGDTTRWAKPAGFADAWPASAVVLTRTGLRP
jgi:hypothetical protein